MKTVKDFFTDMIEIIPSWENTALLTKCVESIIQRLSPNIPLLLSHSRIASMLLPEGA
jgi:hypothetical protein